LIRGQNQVEVKEVKYLIEAVLKLCEAIDLHCCPSEYRVYICDYGVQFIFLWYAKECDILEGNEGRR